MTYPTRRVDGNMTNGETRNLAAIASEIDPETLEAFVIIAWQHHAPHKHEVIVTSNVSDSVGAVTGLLMLAMQCASGLEDTEHASTEDSNISSRYCSDVRSRFWPFRRKRDTRLPGIKD